MKLQNAFKQYGIGVVPRIVKSIFHRVGIIVESFYLLNYIIDENHFKKIYEEYDYSKVRELTISDIDLFSFLGLKKVELYKERFQSGNYSCFAIVENNKISYFTWISWSFMNYPTFFNKREKLGSNQALLEDSYCDPIYRGKGYHSKMNVYRLNETFKRNKSEVLALVLKENTPALKVQLKSRFNYKLKIIFFKIGKLTKVIQKDI